MDIQILENLKELRKMKGLTQTDVAKKVGVSLVAYQMWERQVSKPKPKNMEALKELFSDVINKSKEEVS